MITYLIQSSICLLVFYMTFFFLFSKEKSLFFNRCYLLAGLFLSLLLPLFHSPFPLTEAYYPHTSAGEISPQATIHPTTAPPTIDRGFLPQEKSAPAWRWELAIGYFYALLVSIFFGRFLLQNWQIYKAINSSKKIAFQGYCLVLCTRKDTPFTYFNYIFWDKIQVDNDTIDPKMFHHESVHVQQWHSLDILLIELLKVVFWFNPIIHFYKKAIQLNHEYLADETVNQHFKDISSYQLLLLSHISTKRRNQLASYSNYPLIKNRLIMMYKTKNVRKSLSKALFAIPLSLFIALLFGMKPYQQKQNHGFQNIAPLQQSTTNQGENYLEKYEKLYNDARDEKNQVHYDKLDIGEMRRLWEFMSTEDREKATKVPFLPTPATPDEMRPSNYQMNEWKNNADYGIWLDEKHITNEQLKGYSKNDIAYWQYSSVEMNAKDYGKYTTQVNLLTNDGFYRLFIMKETGYDQKSVYRKAKEIYLKHQQNPKAYKGKLGGDIQVLYDIYERIPNWEKEKYNLKAPTEME